MILEIIAPPLGELKTISATAAAIAKRDDLLARSHRGTSVTSAESAQRAASLLKELADFNRTIEATRKAAKAPFLDAGSMIDEVAKSLTSSTQEEYNRIGKLIGAFNAEQERLAEVARRKAWQEQEDIRIAKEKADREAAEKAAAEERARLKKLADEQAERDRLARIEFEKKQEAIARTRSEAGRAAREAELKAAQEKAAADKLAADAKAEAERLATEQRLKDEAEQRRLASLAAAAEAAKVVIPVAPAKIAGVATKMTICFEVTDIEALFNAAPAYVILSPNNAAIKAALAMLGEGKSLPGVRHWKEAKTGVR